MGEDPAGDVVGPGLARALHVVEHPQVGGRAHHHRADAGDELVVAGGPALLGLLLEEPGQRVVLVGDEAVQRGGGVVEPAGGCHPVSVDPAPTGSGVRQLVSVATLPATTTVVPADQAQPEPGHARPQPPQVAVVLEAAVEGEQQHEGDRPQGGADLHRAYAVEVERLDWSDQVAAVADLVHQGLVVLGKHASNLACSNGRARHARAPRRLVGFRAWTSSSRSPSVARPSAARSVGASSPSSRWPTSSCSTRSSSAAFPTSPVASSAARRTTSP